MKFKRNERIISEFKRIIRVVGLTGGIASGKTVATTALKKAGYTVIDADEISRELTAPGSDTENAIGEMFGTITADGRLDRKMLRKLIACDSEARAKLDAYTHPLIVERVKSAVADATPPVIISAPLLFETALSALCDAVVCVVCPRRIRIERIMARDGLTMHDAEHMIDMQIPDSVRATLADFCVPSDVEISDFESEVVELFDVLFKKCASYI